MPWEPEPSFEGWAIQPATEEGAPMPDFSDFTDEAKKLASEHPGQADSAFDKASQFADEKTGNRFDSEIQRGEQAGENYVGVPDQDQQGQQQGQQQSQGQYGGQGGQYGGDQGQGGGQDQGQGGQYGGDQGQGGGQDQGQGGYNDPNQGGNQYGDQGQGDQSQGGYDDQNQGGQY